MVFHQDGASLPVPESLEARRKNADLRSVEGDDLSYLLLTEPRWDPVADRRKTEHESLIEEDGVVNARKYRERCRCAIVTAGGYTPRSAEAISPFAS